MARLTHNRLSETEVKKARCPKSKISIDLRDGNGLILRISQGGQKHWRYEYRDNNQKKVLPFGRYPTVTLKAARLLSQSRKQISPRCGAA
jgi:hypothetical protein